MQQADYVFFMVGIGKMVSRGGMCDGILIF